MDISKASIIEFLIFVSPKPISVAQIKEITEDMNTEEIEEAIIWLQEHFYCQGRALQITGVAGGYQICTRPEFHPLLNRLSQYHTRHRLSRASLEVLAIIAYKQPITRNEVDEIRGVNSGYIIKNLLSQKLLKMAGRKDCLGRPVLYGTGKEFLEYFGLQDISQLPKEAELKELISDDQTDKIPDQTQ